jgi:hypothetical protein
LDKSVRASESNVEINSAQRKKVIQDILSDQSSKKEFAQTSEKRNIKNKKKMSDQDDIALSEKVEKK